jgi:hypothetical protein
MSDPIASSALNLYMDSLSRCLDAESARRLAEFRVAAPVQERVDVLAERANEGLLTDDERSEYDALISVSEFVTHLRLRTLRNLESNQNM